MKKDPHPGCVAKVGVEGIYASMSSRSGRGIG